MVLDSGRQALLETVHDIFRGTFQIRQDVLPLLLQDILVLLLQFDILVCGLLVSGHVCLPSHFLGGYVSVGYERHFGIPRRIARELPLRQLDCEIALDRLL